MATYTLDQAPAVWRKRALELKKAAHKSVETAALFMRNTARSFAPVKSGDLIMGINANPIRDAEWEVSSVVPKAFQYNKWVNRSAGFVNLVYKRIVRVRMPDGRFITIPAGTVLHYGKSPAHWRWTSRGQYWTNAKIQTTKVFGNIARKNIGNALRVRLI